MEYHKKPLEVVLSKDFTIIYWDRGVASLYDKKWVQHEEEERDGYETMNKFLVREYSFEKGYCPHIVGLLTEALGGNHDSI